MAELIRSDPGDQVAPISSTGDPTDHATDDAWFTAWRRRELSRVDRDGLTYADYTGSALAPESLLRGDAERLLGGVLGNPHSQHIASVRSSADIDEARDAILAFLGASPDEYRVILTANASAALKLVGESFAFGPDRELLLTADNHNSVLGMREFARRRGAAVRSVPFAEEFRIGMPAWGGGGLFAYPAQSNFSGVRHDLGLIALAQEAGYRVLLDAAAMVPTSRLDLARYRPDFVALSLYKIVGWPAGIGALVARHEALAELERPWFAGGTVDWVSVSHERHRLASGPERFEDGTPPFLVAGAVAPALAAVTAVDRDRLARHCHRLVARFLEGLDARRHPDGSPMAVIYGPTAAIDRGATVPFNLLGPDRSVVPHWDVERLAAARRLAIRGGCFCNPGCAEAAFGWPLERVGELLSALGEEFTVPRFGAALGDFPVGAVRASFGLGSVMADVDRTLEVLAEIATAG